MSVEACAALVERGDPDRFAATMAAPLAARERLFILHAFNLEVARAPWVTKEPLIAEMRLQWWRDVVAETAPRAHEVAGPLHGVMQDFGLPVALLDSMIAARRWDIYSDPFADTAALDAYLAQTGGGLMWSTALALGAPDAAEGAVRQFGQATALAGFLRAVPALEARGRQPLPDHSDAGIAALARRGLDWLAAARSQHRSIPRAAAPALLAGWQTGALLRQAAADPAAVRGGYLCLSEFARRGRLIWVAASGRW